MFLICLLAHEPNPDCASSFRLRVNVMSSSCTLFTPLILRCQLVRQKKTTMSKLNSKGFFFLFFFPGRRCEENRRQKGGFRIGCVSFLVAPNMFPDVSVPLPGTG